MVISGWWDHMCFNFLPFSHFQNALQYVRSTLIKRKKSHQEQRKEELPWIAEGNCSASPDLAEEHVGWVKWGEWAGAGLCQPSRPTH